MVRVTKVENDFLYYLQDNFGKLHDRSKETPKSMKQITRLFPNKVVIQLPQVDTFIHFFLSGYICFFLFFSFFLCSEDIQDEAVLLDWKEKLERDTEILKVQANITSILAVSIF